MVRSPVARTRNKPAESGIDPRRIHHVPRQALVEFVQQVDGPWSRCRLDQQDRFTLERLAHLAARTKARLSGAEDLLATHISRGGNPENQ